MSEAQQAAAEVQPSPSPALSSAQTGDYFGGESLCVESTVVKKGFTQRWGNTLLTLAKKKKRRKRTQSEGLSMKKKGWRPMFNQDRFRHDAEFLEVLPKVDTKAVMKQAKCGSEKDSKPQSKKAREKHSDKGSTAIAPMSVAGTDSERVEKRMHPTRDENATTVVHGDDVLCDVSTKLPIIGEDTDDLPQAKAGFSDIDMGATAATPPFRTLAAASVELINDLGDIDNDAKVVTFVTTTGEPMPDKDNYTYFVKPKKGKAKRIAFFDGKLKRVSAIETASETFKVCYHYYLTWLMTFDEVVEYFTAKVTYGDDFEDKWKPDWHPELHCENRVEGDLEQLGAFKVKEGVSFKCLKTQKPLKEFNYGYKKSSFDISKDQLGFDPRYAFWCRVQYDCDLLCAEELELEFFPFDCQDLGVYMRAKEKANACDILPFPRYGEIFNIDAQYSMVSEWKIPGVMLEFNQGDPAASKMGVPYNSVVIRVKAERKWEAHMADSTTIFCMFWLGLATFSVPVEDVGDRLAYSITLLLADIATMQLLNETTPTIPYRTFLDTYTYACFIFLVVITIWVAIAGFGGESTVSHVADWWMFWVFAVVLVTLHLIFINMIHFGRADEKSKLTTNTAQLEALMSDSVTRDSASSMPMAGVSWNSLSIEPKWSPEQMQKLGIETCKDKLGWAARSYPWAQVVDDEYEETDPHFVQRVVKEKKGFLDQIGDKFEQLRRSTTTAPDNGNGKPSLGQSKVSRFLRLGDSKIDCKKEIL